MASKDEYEIIDKWKNNFLNSDVVIRVENDLVSIDIDKCSYLFDGDSNIFINVPCNYDIQKMSYLAFSHFDGLVQLEKLVKFFNYIGIDINVESLAQFAAKGAHNIYNFVQKGWFLFKDLCTYDNINIKRILYNNFGDLKFFAQIAINYNPDKLYTVIIKYLDSKNKYCFFTVKDDSEISYKIYISIIDENSYVSIHKSADGLNYGNLTSDFDDLIIDSQKNIIDLCNFLKNYFLNKGFRIVFNPES